MLLSCSLYLLKSLKLAIVILSNSMVILFLFWYPRFYWIMSLNATVVFLGLSYIQHSASWALVLLTPFMSTLMALITLCMMHYNLIYQPGKCKQITLYIGLFGSYGFLNTSSSSWIPYNFSFNSENLQSLSVIILESNRFFKNINNLYLL